MKKNNLLLLSILTITHLQGQFGCLTTTKVDSETGTVTSTPVHYAGCSCPCADRTTEGICLECGHRSNQSLSYTNDQTAADKKLTETIKGFFKSLIKK